MIRPDEQATKSDSRTDTLDCAALRVVALVHSINAALRKAAVGFAPRIDASALSTLMKNSFNPATDVTSTKEQAAASRWECLRRNSNFRQVADRWISGPRFRCQLDEEKHCPRCALWWMLNPDEACVLSKELLKGGRLQFDESFNFGPVKQRFMPARLQGPLTLETLFDAYMLAPDRRHKFQLTYDDNWLQAPSGFRKQFLVACSGGNDFYVHNGEVIRHRLIQLANRLLACQDAAEARSLGRQLFERIYELREYSDKLLILNVGGKEYPRWRVKELLGRLRTHIPTMTGYSEEKRSWYGTAENWRWYLAWEINDNNVRETANQYIEQKSPGQHATKSIAARQRDARKTIKDHVQVIEHWIKQSYPSR